MQSHGGNPRGVSSSHVWQEVFPAGMDKAQLKKELAQLDLEGGRDAMTASYAKFMAAVVPVGVG